MIRFFDHSPVHRLIAERLAARVAAIHRHGRYVGGPEIAELEERLADYLGVRHAICCANGTDALILALRACTDELLPKSNKPEVITSAYSYYATCETIEHIGMCSRLSDIEPDTYNMAAAGIDAAVSADTVAIMPVSLFGRCADFAAINTVAARHGLCVIEDAAQSFGASVGASRSGASTTVACTSFFPTKPLGCYGDGGACFTNDDEIARRVRHLANHGQCSEAHIHTSVGFNSRLDTLQAAVLLEKMEIIEPTLAQRRRVASKYNDAFAGITALQCPMGGEDEVMVYAQYTLRTAARDGLRAHLQRGGVPTAVYYPRTLAQQPAMEAIHGKVAAGTHPHAENATAQCLSLPIYAGMPDEHVDQVINLVGEYFHGASE